MVLALVLAPGAGWEIFKTPNRVGAFKRPGIKYMVLETLRLNAFERLGTLAVARPAQMPALSPWYAKAGSRKRKFSRRHAGSKRSIIASRPSAANQKRQLLSLASSLSHLKKSTGQLTQSVQMYKNVTLQHNMRTWSGGELYYQSFPLTDIENYKALFCTDHAMGMGMQERSKIRVRGIQIKSQFSCHSDPGPSNLLMLVISAKKGRGPLTELEPVGADQFPFKEGKDWITNHTTTGGTIALRSLFDINTQLWNVHAASKFTLTAEAATTAVPLPYNGVATSYKDVSMNIKVPGNYLSARTTNLSWKDTDINQLPYYQRLFCIVFCSNGIAAPGVAPASNHVVKMLVSSS